MPIVRRTPALRLSLIVLLFSLLPWRAHAAQLWKAAEPITDRYVVTLAQTPLGVDAVADRLASQYHGRILAVWKHAVRGFWIELTAADAARLAADPRVATIEQDAVMHPSAEQITGKNRPADGVPDIIRCPNGADTDTEADSDPLWHLTRISHRLVNSGAAPCEARLAPDETLQDYYSYRYFNDGRTSTNARVKVYLVDTGVWKEHTEFDGIESQITDGENAGRNPDNGRTILPDPAPVDNSLPTVPCGGTPPGALNQGHGTMTASIVVGRNLGVAKGVEVVSVTSLGCYQKTLPISTAVLIGALDWVAAHATPPAVVSISTFRSTPPCGPNDVTCAAGNDLTVLESVFNTIIDKGIPIFASANNQNADACVTTPGRLSRRGGLEAQPGQPTRVVTVGGTDRRDRRWDTPTASTNKGSNFGQCVDIFAPAATMAIAQADKAELLNGAQQTPYGERVVQSGTSFSAPIVAGLAARLMGEDPSLYALPHDGTVADRVWERLRINASRFEPKNVGINSPHLLSYLGGVTFTSQPPEKMIVQDGSPFQLSVAVVGTGMSYQWYRDKTMLTDPSATTATLQLTASPSTTGANSDYWVRVTRNSPASPKYYADSTRTRVDIGSCPLPRVVAQPRTQWAASGTVPMTAQVVLDPGASAHFQWVSVTRNLSKGEDGTETAEAVETPLTMAGASGDIVASQTLSVDVPVTAPASKQIVPTYRLVLTPTASCAADAWKVVSDTAQVRVCAVPAVPEMRPDDPNGVNIAFGGGQALLANVTRTNVRWYYSATGAAGTFAPLRESLNATETAANNGATWAILRDERVYPPRVGWYAAKALGACGESALSPAVHVLSTCSFKAVGRVNPTTADAPYSDAPRTVFVAAGQTARLEVQALLADFSIPVTLSWTWNTGQTSAAITTAPVTGLAQYTATGTDPRSGCVRSVTFTVDVDPATACTDPITVRGGQCQFTTAPIVRAPRGSRVTLRSLVSDSTGELTSGLTYVWTKIGSDGQVTPIANASGPTLEYKIEDTGAHSVSLRVQRGTNCASTVMFAIEPSTTVCNDCKVGCLRRRAVRVFGTEATFYPFTPGETVTLGVPEEGVGYTYEWHQASGGAHAIIGSTANLEVTLDTNSEFWVVTNTGTESIESDRLVVASDASFSPSVTVAPELTVVPAGTTIDITATYDAADATTHYEWRMGPDYALWAPVISTSRILTVHAYDDTLYWCRVITTDPNTGTEKSYYSKFASVVANCTDWVGGTIVAQPARVARGQHSRLNAVGTGKNLIYTWTKSLPNDPTPVPTGGMYGAMDVYPTDEQTHYSATAVDSCGTTGSFGIATVFLCVPTITQQPAASTLVTPGTPVTLTVAATPAVDGQPLSVTWYRSNDVNRLFPLGSGWSFTTTLPAGTNIDSYYAAIASDCGGATNYLKSAVATVETCAYPGVNTQPLTLWTNPGVQVTLSAAASGTTLTYQWYAGTSGDVSTPLNNQTSATLRPSPSSTSTYWCRVTSRGTCSADTPTFTVKVCSPPVITSQPATVLSFAGKTNTLVVSVDTGTNTEPIAYQWQLAGAGGAWTDIAGATSTSYTTPPFTADAIYRLHISVGTCETYSEPITVAACTYPEVVTGGERKIGYNETTSVSLPVMSPVVTKLITWYRGDVGNRSTIVAMGEGTNLTHNTGPLTQDTLYWAEFATDTCVSRTEVFTVRVCKPSVTTQPVGATIASGSSVTLSVGTTPISGQTFQWYTGTPGTITNPVAGATAASLNVTPSATTSYWVRVSGTCGLTADSAAAVVTVCTPPAITNSTASLESQPATPRMLYVTATGSNLTYQWYLGASGVTTNPISNATSVGLTVSPNTTTSYWCRVKSEGLCAADGPTITVTVCNPPTITAQPASQRIFTGGTATFQVTATAAGAMTYQWYTGAGGETASPIAGATSATLTVTPSVETSYWCRVTTSVCTSDSDAASVSFCTYPAVVAGGDRTIAYQQSASLSLPVMSPVVTKDITWYRGNVGDRTNPVAAGTGTNLTYNTPLLTVSTNYWAEFVTDGCVSRTDPFTVRVCKPAITTQPSGTTVPAGTAATLTAAVTSITGQTFQWYIGTPGTTTNPVAGATSASLTVSPAATTTYWLRVTGTCGVSVDSAAATVTVCTPPAITSSTPSHSALSGSTQNLVVGATGTSLTYQWYRGASGVTTNPIANATSSLVQVAPTTTTSYWCKVTSAGLCTASSPTITIDVCNPPVITAEPLSQPQFAGKQVTLSVTASSPGALTYQWYQGASGDTAAPVSGATSSSFTFTATADTSYWCRVTTAVCSTDSAAATITICTYNEVVSASPATINTAAGGSASMQLPVMSPVLVKNITWYRGASGDHTTPLISGTGTNLTLNVAPSVTTQYWAEFDTGGCVSRTTTYTVSVCKPTITTQPQSVVIQNGAQTTLSVAATGAPLTYQWYTGAAGNTAQPIAGATSASYTTPALSATTSYWVRITGCTTADSAAATVTVCNAPTVTLSKSSNVTPGSTGTITATTTGTSLTYQWFRGQSGDTSSPITGATNSTYSFTLSASNYYWVRVTTGCSGASVNSAAILYSVSPVVTSQPASVNVPSGGHATFSVTATGNFLTYQWYRNGSAVAGATAASYTTPALTATTTYFCQITSGSIYTLSQEATATMCDGPMIMNFATTYSSGTTRQLTVTVYSSQASMVKYHWYKGTVGEPTQSVDLGEQANSMMFYNVAAPASTYWVRVWFDDDSCYSDTPGKSLP